MNIPTCEFGHRAVLIGKRECGLKIMNDDEIKQSVELLELILLGNLVRYTSIVWDVRSDICKWDFLFNCRYGAGRIDVVQIARDATQIKKLIETKMSDETTAIIQHYRKRKP